MPGAIQNQHPELHGAVGIAHRHQIRLYSL